jgi:SAM-dependent methyltransferase
MVSVDKLNYCYASSSADQWDVAKSGAKREFGVIGELLEGYVSNRTILDVGCFNGDFMATLGSRWRRFGVEPSEKASRKAVSRGIEVLGSTVFDLKPSCRQFDAITAIDVLEHLPDPLPFLTRAKELLNPGGVLLIQTGDSASWPWRLQGSRHWYCSIPDHVSFFCERTVSLAARRLGMRGLVYRRIHHRRTALAHRMLETAKNLGYVVGNRVQGFGLAKLQALFVSRRAPVWITARDHMVYVLRK